MKKDRLFDIGIPGLAAIIAVALLVVWNQPAQSKLDIRLPQAVQPTPTTNIAELKKVEGELKPMDGRPADLPGTWPSFRGPDGDNIAKENVKLAQDWSQSGPPELWGIDVGEGYAGAAVLNGRVYVHDYDQERQADVIRCLSLENGQDIWQFSYPVAIKRNHGMSRTVPAVTEKYLVALGPKCHVSCLDPETGEEKWMIDLVREYGTSVPPWYAGQCPYIDNGTVVLAPGGKDVLVMAVDCETGKVLWKSPNPHNWKMSHTSIVPMDLGGQKTYVYVAAGGVAGISADTGEILWSTSAWRITVATVPTPVVVGDGKIFLSGGYNAGSMMLQVKQANGTFSAEPLFRLKPTVFGSEQQTPILFENHIYGVIPNGELVCLDLEGNIVWSSGSEHRFGLGPYMMADGMILVMNDAGRLTAVKASADGYSQLAEAKVLNGSESWGPMALAGGRLIVRDLKRMACLDLREK